MFETTTLELLKQISKATHISPNDDLVMMNPIVERIKHHLEQNQQLGVMYIYHHHHPFWVTRSIANHANLYISFVLLVSGNRFAPITPTRWAPTSYVEL